MARRNFNDTSPRRHAAIEIHSVLGEAYPQATKHLSISLGGRALSTRSPFDGGSLDRVVGFCNPQTTATCGNGGRCIPTAESSVGLCECLADSDCTPYVFNDDPNPPVVFSSLADFAGVCSSLQCQFIGCQTDADCPGSSCGPSNTCTGSRPCIDDEDCVCVQGNCWLTGDPCDTAADCFPVCNENGICPSQFQVCGKESGITCNTILTGEAVCRSI